ncbi:MAG: hypothetical protein R2880_15510 [Deinococcales bacterium]
MAVGITSSNSGTSLAKHKSPRLWGILTMFRVAFSPDGRSLASGSWDEMPAVYGET